MEIVRPVRLGKRFPVDFVEGQAPQNYYLGYDTKLYLIISFHFWR